MRYIWAFFGLICVGLAVVGVVLPLLPTVPFLLLAAYFFARSSEKLHSWLVSHKIFGPLILDWQSKGVINIRAKRLSTLSIILIFVLSLIISLRPLILGIQAVVLGCVLFFIWTRPNG
ncbi:MAG: YbaN family protein [Rhodobacterales bacterium]|nr:YbaN family protein [Rhodobacterales bacterium]